MKILEKDFPQGTYPGQKTDGLYIDGGLLHNIKFIENATRKHSQLKVVVICGDPGSGKSTLFTQLARIIDPKFTLDKCCFDVETFIKAVGDTPIDSDVSALGDDEAIDLMGRSSVSKNNKKMLITLARMRSKKIVVFLMLPSFFDLDRTIAMFYTSLVIRCYNHKQLNKGYFEAWMGSNAIRQLYLTGKKTYSYSHPYSNIKGRFVPAFCLPAETYEQKKQLALTKLSEGSKKDIKFKFQRDLLLKNLYLRFDFDYQKLSELLENELCSDEVGKIIRGDR